jgi:hypothetical protein
MRLVACLLVLAAGGAAFADDEHLYVGGRVTYGTDGGDALPFGVEAGMRWRRYVGGHVSIATGPLRAQGEINTMIEILGGIDARACPGQGRVCSGLRFDAGMTRGNAGMGGDQRGAYRAFLIEPMATLGFALDSGRTWEAMAMAGARTKWIAGRMDDPQAGFAASILVARSW